MGRQIEFRKDQMVIHLTGFTMVAGLRNQLSIPYSSIIEVSFGQFHLPWNSLRVGGTSLPNGYKGGRFLYQGKKFFLSYQNPDNVVIVRLKGQPFDQVAVEMKSPREICEAIRLRCPEFQLVTPTSMPEPL